MIFIVKCYHSKNMHAVTHTHTHTHSLSHVVHVVMTSSQAPPPADDGQAHVNTAHHRQCVCVVVVSVEQHVSGLMKRTVLFIECVCVCVCVLLTSQTPVSPPQNTHSIDQSPVSKHPDLSASVTPPGITRVCVCVCGYSWSLNTIHDTHHINICITRTKPTALCLPDILSLMRCWHYETLILHVFIHSNISAPQHITALLQYNISYIYCVKINKTVYRVTIYHNTNMQQYSMCVCIVTI